MSITNELIPAHLNSFFSRYQLSLQGGVVCAFSGGVDSLALLMLLSKTLPPDRVLAVYINHRLRPDEELLKEELLNKENCEKLDIPLLIIRLKKGEVQNLAQKRKHGIEDAARTLRYEALHTVRATRNFAYIATAHTEDDQIETYLMRIFQGSFPEKLVGIQAVENQVIRPLLSYAKERITSYVEHEGFRWSEDSTNHSTPYVRNTIRDRLIPAIQEVFPAYRSALHTFSTHCSSLYACIEDQLQTLINEIITVEGQEVLLQYSGIHHVATPLRERILYEAYTKLNSGRRISYRTIESLGRSICKGWQEGYTYELSDSLLIRKGATIRWSIAKVPLAEGFVSLVYSQRTPLDGRHELVVGACDESPVPIDKRVRLNEALLQGALIVRSSTPSDEILLSEGRKKVSKLISSWKIPRHERRMVPVLEDDNGLCAVLGAFFGGKDRISVRFKESGLAPKATTLYSIVDV